MKILKFLFFVFIIDFYSIIEFSRAKIGAVVSVFTVGLGFGYFLHRSSVIRKYEEFFSDFHSKKNRYLNSDLENNIFDINMNPAFKIDFVFKDRYIVFPKDFLFIREIKLNSFSGKENYILSFKKRVEEIVKIRDNLKKVADFYVLYIKKKHEFNFERDYDSFYKNISLENTLEGLSEKVPIDNNYRKLCWNKISKFGEIIHIGVFVEKYFKYKLSVSQDTSTSRNLEKFNNANLWVQSIIQDRDFASLNIKINGQNNSISEHAKSCIFYIKKTLLDNINNFINEKYLELQNENFILSNDNCSNFYKNCIGPVVNVFNEDDKQKMVVFKNEKNQDAHDSVENYIFNTICKWKHIVYSAENTLKKDNINYFIHIKKQQQRFQQKQQSFEDFEEVKNQDELKNKKNYIEIEIPEFLLKNSKGDACEQFVKVSQSNSILTIKNNLKSSIYFDLDNFKKQLIKFFNEGIEKIYSLNHKENHSAVCLMEVSVQENNECEYIKTHKDRKNRDSEFKENIELIQNQINNMSNSQIENVFRQQEEIKKVQKNDDEAQNSLSVFFKLQKYSEDNQVIEQKTVNKCIQIDPGKHLQMKVFFDSNVSLFDKINNKEDTESFSDIQFSIKNWPNLSVHDIYPFHDPNLYNFSIVEKPQEQQFQQFQDVINNQDFLQQFFPQYNYLNGENNIF
jgi:hypothetical protein